LASGAELVPEWYGCGVAGSGELQPENIKEISKQNITPR
jgi:hypothetical protein